MTPRRGRDMDTEGTCGHVMAGDRGKPQITRGRLSSPYSAKNKSVYVRVYQRSEKPPGTVGFQGLQTPCAGEKDADAGQGPARRGRRVCAVQAFRRRRNLGGLRPQARFGAQPPQRGGTWRGDGGIHFRRALESPEGFAGQWPAKPKEKDMTVGHVFLFGGDYWTRTSGLMRVKMRRDVKALLLGAFRHFWPHFLWVQITALSTVSTR